LVKVLTLFGTRPEVIKLAPVIRELEARPHVFETLNVASGQHTTLLYPFLRLFGLRVDHDLQVMEPGQHPSGVGARVLTTFDPILVRETPDLVLVQGDTTTAMAGALAAFHRHVPVGHVEAGLRSGTSDSPFPEEMNRTLITRLASYHFAATRRNQDTLLEEGVSEDRIFVTGNPVVDALEAILAQTEMTERVQQLLDGTSGLRRIVLTTHRRESFGEFMTENLQALARFVTRHPDVTLLFPVHPNPVVTETARKVLSGVPRIHLFEPLSYEEFLLVLSHAWLIVSDSGGVQEEAPSLGKPLLIIRENTERPEAVECGVGKLVGSSSRRLSELLEEAYAPGSWAERVARISNPFGQGDAAKRIVDIIGERIPHATDRRPVPIQLTVRPVAVLGHSGQHASRSSA
jgi:UDP-N-acetylglucosamine 2-epimerase (non-hydrolysing)